MATGYSGNARWVGDGFGRGTCSLSIDDIDSPEWEGVPATFSLLRTRNMPASGPVTVALVDGPQAEATATAELFVDLPAHSVVFRGRSSFRKPTD